MDERLQKILSQAGVCSRRAAEQYLAAGRVTVNGRRADVGDKADPARDKIAVDGRTIRPVAVHIYLMLHKPQGVVSTLADEHGRQTVKSLIHTCPARVWPVGRLDYDSQGLLLMTNDGDFTNRMTHPAHEVEKEYQVEVDGDVQAALPLLSAPMTLDGQTLRAARVAPVRMPRGGGGATLSITIHEGKNRQVRRMCAAAGLTVRKLTRVRQGDVRLGDLPSGQWRFLTERELAALGVTPAETQTEKGRI